MRLLLDLSTTTSTVALLLLRHTLLFSLSLAGCSSRMPRSERASALLRLSSYVTIYLHRAAAYWY